MNIKKITLENLAESTEQEVFEFIARHLLLQKKQSVSSTGCVYRSPEGLACAAGCILSDEEAELADSRGYGIWSQMARLNIVPELHSGMIRNLQIMHDSTDPDSWREQLTMFPETFGYQVSSDFIKEIP